MDRRFLTVLGVSLLFALVVSTAFYQLSGRIRGAAPKEKRETRDVVVATAELPMGVAIRLADVKVMKVAREQFPKGSFGRPEEVVGRPVISKILAEEPVLEGRLAERGSGSGLSPGIPLGMRAASVKVNDVAGVAGFVLPGVRVDVLVTVKPPGEDGALTTTVLQNIIVLSAGQHIQPGAKGEAINVPVVTLLVSPEQAEILTLASTEGRIQLVLRNTADQGVEKTPGRRVTEFYGAPKKQVKAEKPLRPQPPPVAVAPPPPKRNEVVVIRGTKKSLEVIGASDVNE